MPSVFNIRRQAHQPASLSEKQPIDDTIRRTSIANMDFLRPKDKRSKSTEKIPGSKGSSNKPTAQKPAKLEIEMESPPLVMYGNKIQSSGALMSGQLSLTVSDEEITLQDFEMSLDAVMTTKRPVAKDCPECSQRKTNINKWKIISHPTTYKKGVHKFPFSELLDGKIPATTDGQLGKIEYILHPIAHISKDPSPTSTPTTTPTTTTTIETTRAVNVKRALFPSTVDHQSLRVFPPTNITVVMLLPPFAHAIGDFNAQFRISGINEDKGDHLVRWRVRKVSYRIDEASKIISQPCSKHAKKVGGENKGVLYEDARTLVQKDFREGWKYDFDNSSSAGTGSSIEFEFPFNVSKTTSHTPQCDVETPGSAFEIKHHMVLEIIVSEEIAHKKIEGNKAPNFLSTGLARVLRTQFNLPVTERSGLGISWDEEQPPMYEDVPQSPPHYAHVLDYDGEELRDQI